MLEKVLLFAGELLESTMSRVSLESALKLSKSNIIDTTTYSQKLLHFFYLLTGHRSSEVPSVSWYVSFNFFI